MKEMIGQVDQRRAVESGTVQTRAQKHAGKFGGVMPKKSSSTKAAETSELPEVKPRYERFAEWLKRTYGWETDPVSLQVAILKYHEYQGSDENKKANADEKAARAAARAERASTRKARKSTETATAASESAPSVTKKSTKKSKKSTATAEETKPAKSAKKTSRRKAF